MVTACRAVRGSRTREGWRSRRVRREWIRIQRRLPDLRPEDAESVVSAVRQRSSRREDLRRRGTQAPRRRVDDMGGMDESSGDETLTKARGHICPPDGCDICDGNNCTQCDPSQYSTLAPQGPIFLKDIRSAIPEFPRAVAFAVSRRHWSIPPGRAPPTLNI